MGAQRATVGPWLDDNSNRSMTFTIPRRGAAPPILLDVVAPPKVVCPPSPGGGASITQEGAQIALCSLFRPASRPYEWNIPGILWPA